jgi:hypothetical protein
VEHGELKRERRLRTVAEMVSVYRTTLLDRRTRMPASGIERVRRHMRLGAPDRFGEIAIELLISGKRR